MASASSGIAGATPQTRVRTTSESSHPSSALEPAGCGRRPAAATRTPANPASGRSAARAGVVDEDAGDRGFELIGVADGEGLVGVGDDRDHFGVAGAKGERA